MENLIDIFNKNLVVASMHPEEIFFFNKETFEVFAFLDSDTKALKLNYQYFGNLEVNYVNDTIRKEFKGYLKRTSSYQKFNIDFNIFLILKDEFEFLKEYLKKNFKII